MSTPKTIQYASLLSSQVWGIFEEDCENHIDIEEIFEGDNLTEFIHALCNMMPTALYNHLTDEKKGTVDVNHIANRLCFQFGQEDNKNEKS